MSLIDLDWKFFHFSCSQMMAYGMKGAHFNVFVGYHTNRPDTLAHKHMLIFAKCA